GTERGAHRGDLVFRLERDRAEVLVLRERVQDRRRGRDRIARVEQLLARELRTDDEAERDRFVARDVAVHARLERRRRNLVDGLEDLGRLAVVIAGLEDLDVRFAEARLLRELLMDAADLAFGLAAV